jgi:hypothetical protein
MYKVYKYSRRYRGNISIYKYKPYKRNHKNRNKKGETLNKKIKRCLDERHK